MMNFKITSMLVVFSIVTAIVQPAQAQSVLSKDLCSSVTTAVFIGGNAGVEVFGEVEGGATWPIAVVANAKGKVKGGAGVGIGIGSAIDINIETCIKAKHLLQMYQENLLTPEQRTVVMFYLGQDIIDKEAVDKETVSGLLMATTLSGLRVRQTEAVIRPIATVIDTQTRIISGEISLIDMLDETVYAIEGLVAVMPMDPTLAQYLNDYSNNLGSNIAKVQQGLAGICDDASAALGSMCSNVIQLQKESEALQQNLQNSVSFISKVALPLKNVTGVIDSAKSTTKSLASTLTTTTEKLELVNGKVSAVKKDIVAMSDNVKQLLGGMTGNLDNLSNEAEAAIGSIEDTIITPLKVATGAATSVINDIKLALGKIAAKVQEIRDLIKV